MTPNRKLIILAAVAALAGITHAANIRYIGAELDYGTTATFNTAAITKDIDGDNIAGTDGWYVRSSEIANSTSYATSTHVSPNRNATYHDTGNDGPKTESAPLLQFIIQGDDLDGKILRVGVLLDVWVGTSNTWTYTVKQTVGGSDSATSTLLALNDTDQDGSKLDIAHFNIINAVADDTFVITATPGDVSFNWPGPFEPVWGMTFDSALPAGTVIILH